MSVDVEREAVADDYRQYRTLNSLAVVCLVAGLLSALTFLDWMLAAIPLAGIVAGVLALRAIRSAPDAYTGEHLALIGTLLCGALWAAGWSTLAYVHATEVPPGYERISYDDLQVDPSQPGERSHATS